MDKTYDFDEFDVDKALNYAKATAGEKYTEDLGVVLKVAMADKRNLPTLRFSNENKISLKDYVAKWVGAYLRAFENRPSKRKAKESKTISDPLIKVTLGALINDEFDLELLEEAHTVMMRIENITGDLLEEYLCEKLKEDGWYCCWGSTIDAVDFCHANGDILQVKNSDNSENSSSKRVRNGTQIIKWHRRNSTKENSFNWDKLNVMVERDDLSENNFRQFVSQTVKKNPLCVYINEEGPLG